MSLRGIRAHLLVADQPLENHIIYYIIKSES